MYILEHKGRLYPCPEGNLKTIAEIYAADRDDISWVKTDKEAKLYLQTAGFRIN